MNVRPTLDEQLRGLRRILEQSVAPAVIDSYASSTLNGVIRALEMLEQRTALVGPFLAWDNQETATVLHAIATRVPIDEPLESSAIVPTGDLAALDAENTRLRGLLAGVIPALANDPAAVNEYALVVAHLRERIARYPFTSTATLPSR